MELDIQNAVNSIVAPLVADHEDISFSFHFSEDLYFASLEHCDNDHYLAWLKELSDEEKQACREYNGLYLPPRTIESVNHILISTKQVDKNWSFISTVAHEVKHALNRTDFCRMYCNDDVDSICDHRLAGYFNIWDEYTARKIGHSTYCTVTMPIYMKYTEDEISSLIVEHELPIRLSQVGVILNQNTPAVERIKKAFDILARLSVWKSLFNANLSPLDNRLYEAMTIFDNYDHVEELNLDHIATTVEELRESINSQK